MIPLYDLTNEMKETHFSLQIFDILKQITERCDKWFVDSFIKYPDLAIYDSSNCISDLDYMFTQAIWLSELATENGYKPTSLSFLEDSYDNYIKHGYKYFVSDPRYNSKDNSVYTDEQVVENSERINATAIKILSEINFEK